MSLFACLAVSPQSCDHHRYGIPSPLGLVDSSQSRYASSEPPFDRVYVSTAGDLLALGKTHEASLALRAALAENPRNVHAHVLYAMLVRSLSEDLQVARFHLRKAFQIDRDLAEALLLQQLPAAQLEAAQKPNADLDLLAPTVEDR